LSESEILSVRGRTDALRERHERIAAEIARYVREWPQDLERKIVQALQDEVTALLAVGQEEQRADEKENADDSLR
jgi:molecular chaperone GrpE (heat shock protein)